MKFKIFLNWQQEFENNVATEKKNDSKVIQYIKISKFSTSISQFFFFDSNTEFNIKEFEVITLRFADQTIFFNVAKKTEKKSKYFLVKNFSSKGLSWCSPRLVVVNWREFSYHKRSRTAFWFSSVASAIGLFLGRR